MMDIHRVRFVEYDPQPIHCLSFSDDDAASGCTRLALSRGDGSIEIWTSSDGESIYKKVWVPGRADFSIEALAWCGDRLFSAGLTGAVQEWDLLRLKPASSLDAAGGAVWCMKASPHRSLLAAGCEDGRVRLFDVSLDTLSILHAFEGQDGRVLSLSWHPDASQIVVGGADSVVRKYDVQSGRCVLRITLDDFKARSTLIWDIAFLSDSTIVSADSLGKVQFWNGKHGTLIQSFKLHLADVLTLAVSPGEDEIYSSGVDPKVLCIRKAKSKGSKWIKSGEVRVHTHDVRALALSRNGLLASGGVDTQLIVCSTDSFDVGSCVRYHPFPDSSRFFSVAPKANVLMLQSSSSLKFWQLSSHHHTIASASSAHQILPNGGVNDSESDASASEETKKPTSKSTKSSVASLPSPTTQEDHPVLHCSNGMPVNVLEIRCRDPGFILSSALSQDATSVALSTVDRFWLYSIEHKKLTANCLRRVDLPCYKMAFTTDSQRLVLATVNQGVKVVSMSNGDKVDFESLPCLATGRKKNPSDLSRSRHPVVDFELNSDSSMIATLSSHGRVCICDVQSGELLRKLPRFGNQPVAISFHLSKPFLVLFAGYEREMYCYDIDSDHLHLVGALQMDRKYQGRSKLTHPNGMVALPSSDSLFAIYDNDCIVLIRCSLPNNTPTSTKSKSTRKRKLNSYKGSPLNYQLVLSYQLVLFASNLVGGELVVVERPWSEVLNRLPPTLLRNRYGT